MKAISKILAGIGVAVFCSALPFTASALEPVSEGQLEPASDEQLDAENAAIEEWYTAMADCELAGLTAEACAEEIYRRYCEPTINDLLSSGASADRIKEIALVCIWHRAVNEDTEGIVYP